MLRQLMEEMRRDAGLSEVFVPTKEQSEARKRIVSELKAMLKKHGFKGPEMHRYGDSYELQLSKENISGVQKFVKEFAQLAAKNKMGHSTQQGGTHHEWRGGALTVSMWTKQDRKAGTKSVVVFIGS